MPTINQLPRLSNINGNERLPVYDTNNGDARSISINELAEFFEEEVVEPEIQDNMQVQIETPTGNFIYNITADPKKPIVWLLINPTATVPVGMVTAPVYQTIGDGFEVLVTCTKAVTTFGFDSGMLPVYGSPTSLTAGGFARFRFNKTVNAWFRIA